MIKANLNYLAAGAAVIGGPAAATMFYKRGQQEEALYLQNERDKALGKRLETATELAEQTKRARAAGIDTDQIERDFNAAADNPNGLGMRFINPNELGGNS